MTEDIPVAGSPLPGTGSVAGASSVAGSSAADGDLDGDSVLAAATDDNDWRLTVQLTGGGPEARADLAAGELSGQRVSAELQQRLGGTVAVGSGPGSELYLYAPSEDAAAAASESVSSMLAERGLTAGYRLDRWHPVAEEWEPAEVPLPGTAAEVAAERQRLDAEETSESLAAGVALFEVRVQLASHRDAAELAGRLQAAGYTVVRRWRFLVVGANNADQAAEFASAISEQAPAGAVISTEEVGPGRPYTPFEIAAGSGI